MNKTYRTKHLELLLLCLLLLPFAAVCRAQMVTGKDMAEYSQTFGLPASSAAADYDATLIRSSVPGNVLWPGDRPAVTFQITGSSAIQAAGYVEVIPYGTRGAPSDIWTPHLFRTGTPISAPVSVRLAAGGFQDVTLVPPIPVRFGGYALVLDLGPHGRRFLTSFVRTFPVKAQHVQYPHFCLDNLPLPVLQRLGVHAIRLGVGYKPTTDSDFAAWYAERGRELRAYQAAGVTVLFMVGGGDWGGPAQPLGHQRPWLDGSGVMQDTKFDIAWLPSYDTDFQQFCTRFACDYGWPNGPLTGFSLWNEPWEGISISGWGADMLRYRDMYRHMWQGVDQARRTRGARVLVGGCDSSSNAMDKLFSDGTDTFGPMFDFLSIHYQGLSSTANYKHWVNRKGYGGRVKIWDTESWVGNTDDRVAAIVAGDRAAGYDRAMGVYGGNICETREFERRLAGSATQKGETTLAWSTAASVGAATHFIGERPFLKLLFPHGLPWAMVFGGQVDLPKKDQAEDGTVVVVGDLSEEFGADNLPFRTVRGYAEMRHKTALKAQMAKRQSAKVQPTSAAGDEAQKLQAQIDTPETLSGATLTLPASADYGLYDFYGNPVAARGSRIVVPLDGRGFFLRGSGNPGGFAHLLSAMHVSRIEGIPPLAIVAHDLTTPVEAGPTLHLTLTNVLNRPVTGRLAVTVGGLIVRPESQALTLGANQTRELFLPVSGTPVPSNSYPLAVTFTAADSAPQQQQETLHVNVLAWRTITVDGRLNDWQGVLPQTIIATGAGGPTLTEQAWLPFQSYDSRIQSGLATAYLAYDDRNFYFAAKVADATPAPGTVRFATRDDDQYFYPAVSYLSGSARKTEGGKIEGGKIEGGKIEGGKIEGGKKEMAWPPGVRRYSYRKNPDLPAGNAPNIDNIQLAFNVLPPDQKRYYLTVPGTMPGFVSTQDTDYEYALNAVAPQYGGGTEVWQLAAPNIPLKHFYPRQPRAPGEGAVNGALLVIRRDGDTLLYECAIPWTSMPGVRQRLQQGQTIKFSYRVNNDAGGPTMELSKGRSIAKRNMSFHVDWVEHWANELEFGAQHSSVAASKKESILK